MSDLPGLRRAPQDPTQRAIRGLQQAAADSASARVLIVPGITLTSQTAAISTTNLVTLARTGFYRVMAIAQCTTADAGPLTLTVTIGWTDRVGATTDTGLTRNLAAQGRSSRSYELQVTGDTHITYATSLSAAIGTAVYALEIRVERVGGAAT